jgi:hypothetical protein
LGFSRRAKRGRSSWVLKLEDFGLRTVLIPSGLKTLLEE